MPKAQQREIELQKLASFLIYKLNRREITRGKILQEIDKLNAGERVVFKKWLNEYR